MTGGEDCSRREIEERRRENGGKAARLGSGVSGRAIPPDRAWPNSGEGRRINKSGERDGRNYVTKDLPRGSSLIDSRPSIGEDNGSNSASLNKGV
jgi:hypothetical protein